MQWVCTFGGLVSNNRLLRQVGSLERERRSTKGSVSVESEQNLMANEGIVAQPREIDTKRAKKYCFVLGRKESDLGVQKGSTSPVQ